MATTQNDSQSNPSDVVDGTDTPAPDTTPDVAPDAAPDVTDAAPEEPAVEENTSGLSEDEIDLVLDALPANSETKGVIAVELRSTGASETLDAIKADLPPVERVPGYALTDDEVDQILDKVVANSELKQVIASELRASGTSATLDALNASE